MRMPDPLNGKVLNAHEAREYWKTLRARWHSTAEDIALEIAHISDQALQDAVMGIVGAVGSGRGHFELVPSEEGFNIEAVELDDAVFDRLEALAGEEKMTAAHHWIVKRVQELPSVFVAWAFGELRVRKSDLKLGDKELYAFAWDRVAYSTRERKLLGIQTHPDFSHPNNRFIEVHWHGSKGKT